MQFPILAPLLPRQRKAIEAVEIIRQTTSDLIKKCKVRARRGMPHAAARGYMHA